MAEAKAQRRRIVERVETEWKQPFEALVDTAPLLDLDLETLEVEAERIANALEAIGPVNPLAIEEHAEESKRLAFLQAQRDDLVAARQSLLQAIHEIDGTAQGALPRDLQLGARQLRQRLPDALRRRRVRAAPERPR